LQQGRLFDARDRQGAPKVVLINEAAARKLFPGENPIGRRVGVGQGGFADGAEVIGIVDNQRYVGVEAPPEPDVYIPFAQSPRGRATIFVRTTVAPSALITTVRKEVQRLDPNLPIFDVMTMQERVGVATARTRVTGLLLGLFAATSLVLALVGIYGVIAFAVAQRAREFGLRIALGAAKSDIARLIFRYGATVVGLGIVIGLLGALATTRVLRSMLFEIEPTDPVTFVILTVVTVVVAFAATTAPAIRAMRVDPMIALKSE
jgi:predicted permease